MLTHNLISKKACVVITYQVAKGPQKWVLHHGIEEYNNKEPKRKAFIHYKVLHVCQVQAYLEISQCNLGKKIRLA